MEVQYLLQIKFQIVKETGSADASLATKNNNNDGVIKVGRYIGIPVKINCFLKVQIAATSTEREREKKSDPTYLFSVHEVCAKRKSTPG